MLELQRVSIHLNQREIVKNLSFTVGAGELVGIIGPNGAGKSSLLKAIIGVCPSKGNILIARRNAMTATERAKFVAYIPQDHQINWALSVETIVGFGRFPHVAPFSSLGKQDYIAVYQAMERMGVTPFAKRKATELSGGERARVLIARALAQDTGLLLADEPTSGLDPAYQLSLMECFSQLTRRGRSVLICLHDLGLAASWCSRLILIDQGRLIIDGAPDEVVTNENLAMVYGIKAYISRWPGGLIAQPISLTGKASGLNR